MISWFVGFKKPPTPPQGGFGSVVVNLFVFCLFFVLLQVPLEGDLGGFFLKGRAQHLSEAPFPP